MYIIHMHAHVHAHTQTHTHAHTDTHTCTLKERREGSFKYIIYVSTTSVDKLLFFAASLI